MQLAELAARLTRVLSLFGQVLLLLNLPLLLFTDQIINWGPVLILIFAPQISTLVQLGLSRVREFNADLGAAALTDDPQGLASALQKIERHSNSFIRRLLPIASLPHWLRTHPPPGSGSSACSNSRDRHRRDQAVDWPRATGQSPSGSRLRSSTPLSDRKKLGSRPIQRLSNS